MKQLVLTTVLYIITSLPLSVQQACHWDIWHEGRMFEVHFFANNECIYDQVYFSFQFDVIKQILSITTNTENKPVSFRVPLEPSL